MLLDLPRPNQQRDTLSFPFGNYSFSKTTFKMRAVPLILLRVVLISYLQCRLLPEKSTMASLKPLLITTLGLICAHIVKTT